MGASIRNVAHVDKPDVLSRVFEDGVANDWKSLGELEYHRRSNQAVIDTGSDVYELWTKDHIGIDVDVEIVSLPHFEDLHPLVVDGIVGKASAGNAVVVRSNPLGVRFDRGESDLTHLR